jgi:hypothetical protein
MQPSVQLRSHFRPGDRRHLARIYLADPTLNLFGPRGFNAFVWFAVQRFEQASGQFGSERGFDERARLLRFKAVR